jgi:hypothetical protein
MVMSVSKRSGHTFEIQSIASAGLAAQIGNQSRFYVSLVTPQGTVTTQAGEITRGSKKEPSALLLNILSKVQDAKANVKPMQ